MITALTTATSTSTVPARHPEGPRPAPTPIRVLSAVSRVRKPSDEEFQHLGACLTVGDEPADRLVDWMFAAGRKTTYAAFEQALAHGIESVPDAPAELRAFFTQVEQTPDWVDRDLLRHGVRVLRRGGADGVYISRDVALQGGYMFSGFNQTLLRTGALEKGSNQRFAETYQWALDVTADGGLDVGGIGYQSTLRVRVIHGFVRRHVGAMTDWDGDEWGLPVNQTDMAATLVGAFIVPSAGAIGLGILSRPSDLDAIAHVTRYVGWLLGVRDEFLPRDFRDGIRVLNHTLSALASPDETSKQLAAPMAEDPMSWNYERFAWLRRRIARSQHLSVISAALGPGAMRSLGLPTRVLPWYPAVRIPINVAKSAMTFLPGGFDRAVERGTREQLAFMRTISPGDPRIGASAAHVQDAH